MADKPRRITCPQCGALASIAALAAGSVLQHKCRRCHSYLAVVAVASDGAQIQRGATEGDRAWAAFLVYLELPPEDRHLRRVADLAEAPEHAIQRWAKEWHWRDRAAIHDLRLVERRKLQAEPGQPSQP